MDYDNKNTFTNEYGNKVSYIPEKWVTVGVYDFNNNHILTPLILCYYDKIIISDIF